MVSDYVMTQRHCEALEVAPDAVGLAAYGMDSHMIQRYIDANGYVQNEGNVECPVKSPYPISYRALIPKREECSNLLVPVCLSASHIAYGSIRMEPVFMVLGQSSAIAAALAIDKKRRSILIVSDHPPPQNDPIVAFPFHQHGSSFPSCCSYAATGYYHYL